MFIDAKVIFYEVQRSTNHYYAQPSDGRTRVHDALAVYRNWGIFGLYSSVINLNPALLAAGSSSRTVTEDSHKVAILSYIGDGCRNFEPRSSDEEDTRASTPFTNFHNTPT
ncbi:hypothetical protein TNCV_1070671 [Trichonephila clavipes]|nr:hypothetical protein TNCV_1070671 [Trichonephila clavipes]